MSKTRSKSQFHPSLFEPIPNRPDWAQLPLSVREQLTPTLIKLLNDYAARKLARVSKGGADE